MAAEFALAVINLEAQQENHVRHEFGCRIEEFARGMAIDANVVAAIPNVSDVGVAHGHLTDKLDRPVLANV